MSIITRGSSVTLRRGARIAVLDLAAIELRNTETTRGQVEQRLANALNAVMSPATVSVHVRSLSVVRYNLMLIQSCVPMNDVTIE